MCLRKGQFSKNFLGACTPDPSRRMWLRTLVLGLEKEPSSLQFWICPCLNKFLIPRGKKCSFYLKFPSALQFSNKIHCVGMPDTIQVDMNSSMRVSNELPNVCKGHIYIYICPIIIIGSLGTYIYIYMYR